MYAFNPVTNPSLKPCYYLINYINNIYFHVFIVECCVLSVVFCFFSLFVKCCFYWGLCLV